MIKFERVTSSTGGSRYIVDGYYKRGSMVFLAATPVPEKVLRLVDT
jgi:uncharacterized DUF497 family protein